MIQNDIYVEVYLDLELKIGFKLQQDIAYFQKNQKFLLIEFFTFFFSWYLYILRKFHKSFLPGARMFWPFLFLCQQDGVPAFPPWRAKHLNYIFRPSPIKLTGSIVRSLTVPTLSPATWQQRAPDPSHSWLPADPSMRKTTGTYFARVSYSPPSCWATLPICLLSATQRSPCLPVDKAVGLGLLLRRTGLLARQACKKAWKKGATPIKGIFQLPKWDSCLTDS